MDNLNSRARQVNIGSNSYTITLLPARQGMKIGTEILQMIAPILGAILDDDQNKDVRFDGSTLFTEIALHLVNHIDSNKVVGVVDSVLAELYKGSHKVDYDIEFSGRLPQLITLVEHALRENFGDFFTSYFKEKGFEIPSLKELMEKRVQIEPSLNKESEEIQQ